MNRDINSKLTHAERKEILALIDEAQEIDRAVAGMPRSRQRSKLLIRKIQLKKRAAEVIERLRERGIDLPGIAAQEA